MTTTRQGSPPTSRPAPSTSGTCRSATTSPPTSATSTRARSRRWSGSATTAPPASSTGASSRTSQTRPPTCSASTGSPRATGSRSSSLPLPRPRRSSSAPGSSARSCSRCRCSTATTASATGSSDSTPKVLVTDAANAPRFDASLVDELLVLDDGDGLLAGQPTDPICEDTSADDPAQLYYTSGTTGKAKGIVHAHRYILAHEEFVYCHDIRDGERFHGMGEWAWAAGISPLLGPWRLGRRPVRAPARGAASYPPSSSTSSPATRSRTCSRPRPRCGR